MKPEGSVVARLGPSLRTRARWASATGLVALSIASMALSACVGRTAVSPATPGQSPPQPATVVSAACVQNEQGIACLPVAAESDRVDLAAPSFSNPTQVDNPLHPTGTVPSALYLGSVGGLPFRTEVTLLPSTTTIEWNGQSVEVLESQYFAYLDGRIHEVAIDWYAQADDGSVWYFGEDVFNYEAGVVADTHGTWLAGRDGPAAMIMPAHPQVGDVYRPENTPGVVFEEVEVQSIGLTVDGPLGPVPGAIVVRELHMDGTYEQKTFASGYGEFSTGGGGDLEAMALAVPTDSSSAAIPEGLATLTASADRVSEAALLRDWETAKAGLAEVSLAWEGQRGAHIPAMLETQMSDALASLAETLDRQQPADAGQAAIDVARSALDLQLQYRPSTEIDLARFELMARQAGLDAANEDAAGVAGDAASLEWIRDRFVHTLASSEVGQINDLVRQIRSAADRQDLVAAGDAATRLGEVLVSIRPPA